MRVRLCIDPNAADLHAYPWERLFMQWQGSAIPLAASSLIPFSRFIPLEEGQQEPIEDRPIRLLLAVSSPTRLPNGLVHINVEEQLRSLTAAISTVPDLDVTVLPGHTELSDAYREELAGLGFKVLPGSTTLERLIEAAGKNHIVHLLSHGTFDGKTASLFLEKEDGDFEKAIDTDITNEIASLSQKPKLIYLSACDTANQTGAQATSARPMVGLAPKLVQAGVPAVIAMQTQVEIETARKLAASFYAKVLESGEVDRALSEARFEIYGPKSTEWWIPVLFLRLKNGRLFATDPVREAMQAIQQQFPVREDRYYLPLEAISLKGKELIRDWERTTGDQKSGADLWQMIQNFRPGLTVIAGNAGTGKSIILQRLARSTAQSDGSQNGTGSQAQPRIVQLFIDMREYTHVRVSGAGRLRNLMYETFRALAPSLSEPKFDQLLSGKGGVLFRFLFDSVDLMADNARQPALLEIEQLADGSPHQFLLAMDCRLFEPSDAVDELLVIQPLSARKVVKFLSAKGGDAEDQLRNALLEAIDDAELFELAAMPWLLLHMLDQVKRNLPRSRVMVLEDWVDTALYSAAADGGRGVRAKESLYALGWKMHSERCLSLPIEQAFTVLRGVRNQREYNLETLLNQLVDSRMLVRVGEEAIRFTYPPLQGYCAACAILRDPRQAEVIEDVAATLGQSSRVVWWGRVLSLLAGMMADPIPVLAPLVYGASLTQGEQVFVAAECLIEYDRTRVGPTSASSLPDATTALIESFRQQICAALLWRTKRGNEFRFHYRERAVEALGLFRREEPIPTLIALAVDRVRKEQHGELEFEYSQVRFAAIRALLRVRDQVTKERLAGHPHADDLIAAWIQADVPGLTALLIDSDEGVQGGAAFALGDLQTSETGTALYAAFRDSRTSPSTLWAVADAIRELEPVEVWTELILPCITEAGDSLPQTALYERLLFLIGELRIHDERARSFVSRYLSEPAPAALKGRALVALGKLHAVNEARAQRWEAAIHGDFAGICAVADPNSMFLRRKTIEAVGNLGDIGMLYRARQAGEWVPELDEPFFRAAEECLTVRGTMPGNNRQQTRGDSSNGSE